MTGITAAAAPPVPRSRLRAAARPAPLTVAALAMLGSLVFLAVAGPLLWGQAADHPDPLAVLRPPSSAHWLGTDGLGRDLLARVLAASRLSLIASVESTALGACAGVALGALTAVVGSRTQRLIGAVVNLLLAFPGLLVAIFFAVIFGAGTQGAVFALAAASAPTFARITQTLAAGVAGLDYVAAARVLGLRRGRILLRHVLPNIAEPLLLNATTTVGAVLVGLSGLSFLGLGVQVPSYDWGLLLNQGLSRIYTEPLSALGPGIAIVYAGVTFQLLGEVLAGQAARRGRSGRAQPPSAARPAGPKSGAGAGAASPTDDDAAPDGAASRGAASGPVLDVSGLRVSLRTPAGWIQPVRGVDLTIGEGEIVGIVGESGSGKTLTAMAVADLLPETAHVEWRSHRFLQADVTGMPPRQRRAQLASGIAVVFQNPATALNPALRIGTQVTEGVRVHHRASARAAREQATATLHRVALTAAGLLRMRPHQLSGGMRQRVVTAMGLMMRPQLIIADEPTTALDVTVAQQVLDLLAGIRREAGTSILLISHDMAVVRKLCDLVLVMYGGLVVERVPASRLVAEARHPYTRALLAAVPSMSGDRDTPLAAIDGIPPDPLDPPAGCPFYDRCGRRQDTCATSVPPLTSAGTAHDVACWNPVTP